MGATQASAMKAKTAATSTLPSPIRLATLPFAPARRESRQQASRSMGNTTSHDHYNERDPVQRGFPCLETLIKRSLRRSAEIFQEKLEILRGFLRLRGC